MPGHAHQGKQQEEQKIDGGEPLHRPRPQAAQDRPHTTSTAVASAIAPPPKSASHALRRAEFELGQLYGLTTEVTDVLRLKSNAQEQKGRLRSVMNAAGEWAPPFFDEAGHRIAGLEALPEPIKLPAKLAISDILLLLRRGRTLPSRS